MAEARLTSTKPSLDHKDSVAMMRPHVCLSTYIHKLLKDFLRIQSSSSSAQSPVAMPGRTATLIDVLFAEVLSSED